MGPPALFILYISLWKLDASPQFRMQMRHVHNDVNFTRDPLWYLLSGYSITRVCRDSDTRAGRGTPANSPWGEARIQWTVEDCLFLLWHHRSFLSKFSTVWTLKLNILEDNMHTIELLHKSTRSWKHARCAVIIINKIYLFRQGPHPFFFLSNHWLLRSREIYSEREGEGERGEGEGEGGVERAEKRGEREGIERASDREKRGGRRERWKREKKRERGERDGTEIERGKREKRGGQHKPNITGDSPECATWLRHLFCEINFSRIGAAVLWTNKVYL